MDCTVFLLKHSPASSMRAQETKGESYSDHPEAGLHLMDWVEKVILDALGSS